VLAVAFVIPEISRRQWEIPGLFSSMTHRPAASENRKGVFDRPLHLAGILDNAADELDRTWFGYEWNDRTRCNCGIVARQVLQTTPARLKELLPPIYENGTFRPSWRSMAEAYCCDSGLPRHEVFARLLGAGLHAADFSHLEDLSHPDIVQRMDASRRGARRINRSRKSDVVAYLRAWAGGIEQFHDQAIPAGAAVVG
jgi:hypothetical protein